MQTLPNNTTSRPCCRGGSPRGSSAQQPRAPIRPRGSGSGRVVAVRAAGNGNGALPGNGVDVPIELVNGRVTSGPDLSVEVNGMKLPNPFVIGSGPPGTNYTGEQPAPVVRGW